MNRPRRRRNAAGISLRIFFALSSLHGFWWCPHGANASIVASKVTPHSSTSASASESAVATGEDGGDDPSTRWSAALLQQTSKNQNPYVLASPLSVAAVCRDGIALVSLHYVDFEESPDGASHTTANNASCEALVFSSSGNETVGNVTLIDNGNNSHETNRRSINEQQQKLTLSLKFRDLPLSSRGPLRIEPIYENTDVFHSPPPMSLLTAGWRTDGMALADTARELMMEEVRLYCLPSLGPSGVAVADSIQSVGGSGDGRKETSSRDTLEGKQQDDIHDDANVGHVVVKRYESSEGAMGQQPYYGRRISEGLSYYLAKCVFSEGVRSLSCIGLLACGSGRRGIGGSLYLIDATGTHCVRAHAIGNGSSALHRRLVFVDFEKIDCHEGLRVLLRLIAEEGGIVPKYSIEDESSDVSEENAKSLPDGLSGSISIMATPAFVGKARSRLSDGEGQLASIQQGRQWNLPFNTAAELAVLKNGNGRMSRVRLSTLFSNNKS